LENPYIQMGLEHRGLYKATSHPVLFAFIRSFYGNRKELIPLQLGQSEWTCNQFRSSL